MTCVIAEDCSLPCSFPPSGHDAVRWFRQDVAVLSFLSAGSEEEEEGDDEDKEEDEGEERGQRYDDRASVSPEQVAHGNATLVLRDCGPKDRGRYRCHVTTPEGTHESHVLVKVEGEAGRERSLRLYSPITHLSSHTYHHTPIITHLSS